MSQPVKLSDTLVLDARLAGDLGQRSIAGQVEFWARLGRSVELLLNGRQLLKLAQTGDTRPLSELLQQVDQSAGRRRLKTYLEGAPFPHYRSIPGKASLLERTEQDGTHTVGRFVNRQFVPQKPSPKSAVRSITKPERKVASSRL